MGTVRAVGQFAGVASVALLLASLGAGTAVAQDVACGMTVTHSITLHDDLTDCPSGKNGLTIGADGITVDLNEHNIIGSPGSATGIDNSDGHSELKITGGGSVVGFTDGIVIRDSGGAQVTGLTIQGNAGIGLRVVDSNKGHFLSLTVESNHGGGAVFDGADGNDVRDTRFNRNGGDGLDVAGDSNTIVGNWANNNAGDGFVVLAKASSTQLSGNKTSGNKGSGFRIESARTTVKGNIAKQNAKFGIDADNGPLDGGGNQADGNGASPQCTGVVCR